MKKVLIIGSGLSGLSCARYLDKNKFDIHIFDKHDMPGGRVSSDMVDGCICDVGFQVLLDNYSEVHRLGIYDRLKLQYFDSGDDIYSDGTLQILSSNLVPQFQVVFNDLFPYSLSTVTFDATDTDIEYFTADVSFKYTIYNLTDMENKAL